MNLLILPGPVGVIIQYHENVSTLTERVDLIELSKDMPTVSRPISISDSIGTEQTKVEGHQMTYAIK